MKGFSKVEMYPQTSDFVSIELATGDKQVLFTLPLQIRHQTGLM